jgi:hypothetical protein
MEVHGSKIFELILQKPRVVYHDLCFCLRKRRFFSGLLVQTHGTGTLSYVSTKKHHNQVHYKQSVMKHEMQHYRAASFNNNLDQ